MWFTKLELKPYERAIITDDKGIQQILSEGKHTLFTFGKKQDIRTFNIDNPSIDWVEKTKALRFNREQVTTAWDIIETDDTHVAFVWGKYLPCAYIAPNQTDAFWKTNEPLTVHQQALDEYWLPEEVQAQLFRLPTLPTQVLSAVTARADQRLLLIYKGQLKRILDEGEYVLFNAQKSLEVRAENLRHPQFKHELLDIWRVTCPELVEANFTELQASENETVLVYNNDELIDIVPPSQKAFFWKSKLHELKFERITAMVKQPLPEAIVNTIKPLLAKKNTEIAPHITMIVVPEHHQAIVYIDNEGQAPLPAGVHFYWNFYNVVKSMVIDMRAQTLEISGQEILTQDKVNLRLNLTCNYRVTDAQAWVSSHEEPREHLYREIQFAIRAVVGGQNLDSLLNDKQIADEQVLALLKAKAIAGVTILSVGVKDVILPGEMRAIFTQVVEAEKIAQANNIRRREETAATRSLLNTARVMEENPTALRLKELETLEKITEKIDKISVFGGLDGVLNGLINIQPKG